jgi:hypothetical protein
VTAPRLAFLATCLLLAGAGPAPAELRLGPAPAQSGDEAPPAIAPGALGGGMLSLSRAALLGGLVGIAVAPGPAAEPNGRDGDEPGRAARQARDRADATRLRKELRDRLGSDVVIECLGRDGRALVHQHDGTILRDGRHPVVLVLGTACR